MTQNPKSETPPDSLPKEQIEAYSTHASENLFDLNTAEEPANPPTSQIKPPERWLRNYLPMGIGQVLSLLGSALVQFALIWYLTQKTGSALTLLTATLTGTLPAVFLGPFAGALVDRWNRKLTMIFSDGLVALATLVLVILFATNRIAIWHIYIILFVRSLAGIFQAPALNASSTLMIPKEHFTRYSGMQQSVYGIINIVAPPLGALLIAYLPMQAVLAIDTVTATIAILLLLFLVKVPQPQRSKDRVLITTKLVLRDVKEGIRFVVSWKGVLLLLIGGTIINMVSMPALNLLPLFVQEYFQRGASAYAGLNSALGIGTIIGGISLGLWGGFKRRIMTVMMGILGLGSGMFILGLLPRTGYYFSVGLMVLIGFMFVMISGPLNAAMKEKIPPEMQGRFFTVMSSMVQATVPLGLIIAAPIAELLSISTWYLIGGGVCLALGVFGLLYKPLATLDDQQGPNGIVLNASQEQDPQE